MRLTQLDVLYLTFTEIHSVTAMVLPTVCDAHYVNSNYAKIFMTVNPAPVTRDQALSSGWLSHC